MVATPDFTRTKTVWIVLAVAVGTVVGILAVVPLGQLIRSWLDLPEPTAVPLDAVGPINRPFTATYWVPWLLAWTALVATGIATIVPARTRGAGWAYFIAVGFTGGVIALLAGFLEYGLG
ncbi:hypothetical protein [Gordonia soli]|uniref:Uncharacterized protein n=1 Tax=Gordonia soli NBRC 108243 TaxID=1223545 RepID=M0QIV9_9ACTN|nr:hypothetical protein [Gordonia soli]GAC68570.1 hypothetical protein GS4_16_01000 [Gordonia soli NBRC 108243]